MLIQLRNQASFMIMFFPFCPTSTYVLQGMFIIASEEVKALESDIYQIFLNRDAWCWPIIGIS